MPDTGTATLRDVTTPNLPAAPAEPAQPTVTPAAPTTTFEVADRDAADIGRLMLDSGITKDQVNDVLQAPQALAAIRYMIENDPQEFIRSLERTNPGAGENFLDKLSKLYVDRYSNGGSAPTGKAADAPNAELMTQIRALSEEVNTFKTQAQQAANASAMAQVQARYNARVDDLFSQLPEDKFPLTDTMKDLIKGKLSADLASDRNIVQRVSNGNFVDVPKTFKTIVERIATDRVSATNAEKARRERSTAVSLPEFSGGPAELPKDFYDVSGVDAKDLWDEGPLVRILEGTK